MKLRRDPECTLCGLHKTANYVCLLGSGPVPCKVMIVGEAPGEQEEKRGKPFVGRAGQLLREILAEHFSKDEYFITNVVACRPPGNRNPSAKELDSCTRWFAHQVRRVKPKYVLLLGNISLKAVLDLTGIKKQRGKPIEQDGVIYLPAFHPAFVLRDPTQRDALESDIRLFKDIIDNEGVPKEKELNPVVVNDARTVRQLLKALRGHVSVDIETSQLYAFDENAHIRAIGFGTRRVQWAIPVEQEAASPWLRRNFKKVLQKIDKKLQDCYVSMQFGKFDSLWLRVHCGLDWYADFDTGLAHYLLDENSPHGLKYLSSIYFGAVPYDIGNNEKTSGKLEDWPKMVEYLAKDVLYTRRLKGVFAKQLSKEGNLEEIFKRILLPASRMFTDIEEQGVFINVDQMDEAEATLISLTKESRLELEGHIPKGYEKVNWNAHGQVQDLLFKGLKIAVTKRSDKSGKPSADASVLKSLEHPIGNALLKYRKTTKLLDAFINGWRPYLVDDYLHPSYQLTKRTGRSSANDPNLQQTPRDKRIRSLITAPPGWVLVEADLSQIELRIAAELAGERTMLEAFDRGEDIHWLTAVRTLSFRRSRLGLVKRTGRKILNRRKVTYDRAIKAILKAGKAVCTGVDDEWKELRFHAKAINFGFLYGMYPKHFREHAFEEYGIEFTLEEATELREAYFSMYPDLVAWHERQRRYVRRHGYICSLSGRKRRLPQALTHYETNEVREAERQAINTPVQSFANELGFMAGIEIREEFSRKIARLCGYVHDALLFIVREEHVGEVVPRVLEIMSHPELLDIMDIRLRVPIEAEANIGPWGSGKELEQWQERKAA